MQMRYPNELQVEENINQFPGPEHPQELSNCILATIKKIAALSWDTKQSCRYISVLGRQSRSCTKGNDLVIEKLRGANAVSRLTSERCIIPSKPCARSLGKLINILRDFFYDLHSIQPGYHLIALHLELWLNLNFETT